MGGGSTAHLAWGDGGQTTTSVGPPWTAQSRHLIVLDCASAGRPPHLFPIRAFGGGIGFQFGETDSPRSASPSSPLPMARSFPSRLEPVFAAPRSRGWHQPGIAGILNWDCVRFGVQGLRKPADYLQTGYETTEEARIETPLLGHCRRSARCRCDFFNPGLRALCEPSLDPRLDPWGPRRALLLLTQRYIYIYIHYTVWVSYLCSV